MINSGKKCGKPTHDSCEQTVDAENEVRENEVAADGHDGGEQRVLDEIGAVIVRQEPTHACRSSVADAGDHRRADLQRGCQIIGRTSRASNRPPVYLLSVARAHLHSFTP